MRTKFKVLRSGGWDSGQDHGTKNSGAKAGKAITQQSLSWLSFHVAPGESSPPSSFWQLSLALVPFLFKASNQSVLNH